MSIMLDSLYRLIQHVENLEERANELKAKVNGCPLCEESKVCRYCLWDDESETVDRIFIKDGYIWYNNSDGTYKRYRLLRSTIALSAGGNCDV